jgi:hypothetical protein
MQNYFYYNYEYNNNEGLIKSGAYNNGLLISNNILLSYEGANLTIDSRSSATIENNVILGGTSTLNNSIFQNNIVISGTSLTAAATKYVIIWQIWSSLAARMATRVTSI